MQNITKLAWLVTAALPLSQPAWSAEDLITREMADEARMWQQKDREDLAATIWRKLLVSEPRHAQALVQLGLIEARSGDLNAAQDLYARARRLSPSPAGLGTLAAAIELRKNGGKPGAIPPPEATRQPPAAAQPGTSAKTSSTAPAATTRKGPAEKSAASPSGKPANTSAAATQRRTAPPPNPALDEETLARPDTPDASLEKWAETRQKLEELVQRTGDGRHRLALARHLTLRDETRREGIRQLAGLPDDQHRDNQTRNAWRSALLALTPRSSDASLYSDYLQRYPDDVAVDDRGRGLPMTTNEPPRTAQGRALPQPSAGNGGDTTARAGVNPKAQAEALVRAAATDERAGANGAAARKLEQAMLLDPANPAIRLALARQYEAMGAFDAAASLLDGVLVAYPALSDAALARAQLFVTQERWHEGLYLLERLPSTMRSSELTTIQHTLWAGAQMARARHAYAAGDLGLALTLLEQAETHAAGNPAMLAIVAKGWADCGESGKGLRMMRSALSGAASPPVSLQIDYAELLLLDGQDTELTAVLRGLAASGGLTPAHQERINAIILAYTVRLADGLREAGKLADAATMLAPVIQRVDAPRALLAMARVHQAKGDPARALPLVEKALATSPTDIGSRLLAAGLAAALKDLDKAEVHVNAAAAIAPQHPRVLSAAGQLERARGNSSKAIEYFAQSYSTEFSPPAVDGGPSPLLLKLVAFDTSPAGLIPLQPPGDLLPIPQSLPMPVSTAIPLVPASTSLASPRALPAPETRVRRKAVSATSAPASDNRNTLRRDKRPAMLRTGMDMPQARHIPMATAQDHLPRHIRYAHGEQPEPGAAGTRGIRLKMSTSLDLRRTVRLKGTS